MPVSLILAISFYLDEYLMELYGIRNRLIKTEIYFTRKNNWYGGIDVEFIRLQFRKLLEQIAMLSLIAILNNTRKFKTNFPINGMQKRF